MVMSPAAQFTVARQIRSAEGAAIGDVFSFVSGLYFRGKLAYARRFARPPDPSDPVAAGGVLVITPNAGLRSAQTAIGLEQFTAFARATVDIRNAGYRIPLEQGARALLESVGPDCEVVLLGSIASGKYVEILQPIFGDRLVFPPAFVGRGDMSRGGLMLRCVMAGIELEYVPIAGAVRHGQRPPRLEPIKGILGQGTREVARAGEGATKTNGPSRPAQPDAPKPLAQHEDEAVKPGSRPAMKPVAAKGTPSRPRTPRRSRTP
jgi:hypothetical protein